MTKSVVTAVVVESPRRVTVTVEHTPNASYTRSVHRMGNAAWRKAIREYQLPTGTWELSGSYRDGDHPVRSCKATLIYTLDKEN